MFVNGRRVASKSGFKTKGAAEIWYDTTKAAYRSGSVDVRKAATIDEALRRFEMYHLPTVRPGTRTRYVVDLEYRIKPFFRFMRLDDVTPQLLEVFKQKISGELKPKSVNNCLHLLRLILNKTVRYGLIKESPYDLDSLAVVSAPYPWWDKREDIASFLDEAKKSRYYAVYLLALETGMRYGEIVGLSKDDVDLEQGTLHVHRQWLERQKCYGPTKGGEPRWVDFVPGGRLAQALDTACRVSKHEEAVFTTQSGGRPFKSGLAEKFFKGIQRRAGVPTICFHGLRHTFASWYMREHDNIWVLKSILGHKDIKTTQRYAHHSQRERQKPLDMASVITHKSRTRESLRIVSSEDHSEKKWRDGRDLNPHTAKAVSI